MYLAIENFLCDGVWVKKGEVLSAEKVSKLEQSLSLLGASGLLEYQPDEPVLDVVVEPESGEPVLAVTTESEIRKKKKKKG